MAVGHLQLSGGHRLRQCHRADAEFTGGGWPCGFCVAEYTDAQRQAQLGGALLQQLWIGDDHQFMGVRLLRNLNAQVGTDAGWFTGGNGKTQGHERSLIST